jgi:hypothetical protein
MGEAYRGSQPRHVALRATALHRLAIASQNSTTTIPRTSSTIHNQLRRGPPESYIGGLGCIGTSFQPIEPGGHRLVHDRIGVRGLLGHAPDRSLEDFAARRGARRERNRGG